MHVTAKEAPRVQGRAWLRLPLPVLACVAVTACASGGASPGGAPAPSAAPAATPAVAPTSPADGASVDDLPPVEDVPRSADVPTVGAFDGGSVRLGFSGEASSVRDTVLQEPAIRIWAVLPDVFRTLGVPARKVDPATYTIGLETRRVARIEGGRLSAHLECGNGILGPNADHYDVTMTLMVQLMRNAGGGTLVRTTLDAYARPRSVSGDPLHCASSRTLERRVVELVLLELSGVATTPASVAARGRIPVTGDHLRVECVSPTDPTEQVEEGRFLGTDRERLVLGVGSSGSVVAVPAANVTSVLVRERRSRSQLVGLLGAVAGGVTGGLWGSNWYDSREGGVRYDRGRYSSVHYGKGVYATVGALGGGIAGYFLGRIGGSFIHTDTWLDAPADWTLRFTGLEPNDSSSEPMSCPTLPAGN